MVEVEGVLSALALVACTAVEPIGVTTTTGASPTAGLVSGEHCLRDSACTSGFCDHPVGFCEVPGVCRDLLPCKDPGLGDDPMRSGEACARSVHDRGAPTRCVEDLEEAVTEPLAQRPLRAPARAVWTSSFP